MSRKLVNNTRKQSFNIHSYTFFQLYNKDFVEGQSGGYSTLTPFRCPSAIKIHFSKYIKRLYQTYLFHNNIYNDTCFKFHKCLYILRN